MPESSYNTFPNEVVTLQNVTMFYLHGNHETRCLYLGSDINSIVNVYLGSSLLLIHM